MVRLRQTANPGNLNRDLLIFKALIRVAPPSVARSPKIPDAAGGMIEHGTATPTKSADIGSSGVGVQMDCHDNEVNQRAPRLPLSLDSKRTIDT